MATTVATAATARRNTEQLNRSRKKLQQHWAALELATVAADDDDEEAVAAEELLLLNSPPNSQGWSGGASGAIGLNINVRLASEGLLLSQLRVVSSEVWLQCVAFRSNQPPAGGSTIAAAAWSAGRKQHSEISPKLFVSPINGSEMKIVC